MKTWPPLRPPSAEPSARRRIPAFHPVPVGPRKDGWTPRRQAAFVGFLAETRCVTTACRRVGMGKESAYRLRRRRGAAGFAAAWDAALGKPHQAVDLASAKSTGLDAAYRTEIGLLQVVMSAGRFTGSYWKEDNNALLQHVAQLDRSSAGEAREERKPRRVELPDASAPRVDFEPVTASPPVEAPAWPGPEAPSTIVLSRPGARARKCVP